MTLLQIIHIIKETALAQPNVNTFVRNFLDLNKEYTKYSAIVLQDRDGLRDRIQEQDWNTFTFHLGYVDRLTFDESNRDDIFSTGVNIINNIVASLRQRWFPDIEVSVIDRFSTFDQRFTASCAGVYVVLAIQIPVSDCVDTEQMDIYDKYEAKFTENGHYHFVPDGKPYDEIDITIDVQGAKPEEVGSGTAEVGPAADIKRYYPSEGYVFREFDVLPVNAPVLYRTITDNGDYYFEPTESGEEAYSAVSLSVEVPSKEERPLIPDTITENGEFHYTPEHYSYVYKFAEIEVDVHPSESLVETITTNGSHTYTGEWTNAVISVDVHPSQMLRKTISDAGGLHIEGEWTNASIDLDMNRYSPTFTSNGVFEADNIFADQAEVTVDVHPSESLSRRYTTNGSKTITGEFNGGTINIDVHPSQSLIETISTNGSHSFSGEWTDAVITTDVHPSQSLVQSISTNGSHSFSGEWTNAEITVDVHPSQSLVQNISTNGVTSLSGEWTNAEITVAVPTTLTVTMTQSQYDALSVKDSNTIYLING